MEFNSVKYVIHLDTIINKLLINRFIFNSNAIEKILFYPFQHEEKYQLVPRITPPSTTFH